MSVLIGREGRRELVARLCERAGVDLTPAAAWLIVRLAETKKTRDSREVSSCLEALKRAAETDGTNLMPLLIDCAKAYCTVGEMVEALKQQWGEFQQPVVF